MYHEYTSAVAVGGQVLKEYDPFMEKIRAGHVSLIIKSPVRNLNVIYDLGLVLDGTLELFMHEKKLYYNNISWRR